MGADLKQGRQGDLERSKGLETAEDLENNAGLENGVGPETRTGPGQGCRCLHRPGQWGRASLRGARELAVVKAGAPKE